ncbi:enterobactin exporter EntS [Oligella ureolytica]|uniref:Enterobactin exporter EntS n=1 Tax=Oligella ureolytica TaxID=90244 RepID=A0A378XB83_9BURK|nr:MFS transporter [Oligella ureolytica]QPT40222.1 MFS transporter [Oligella ureolytica]SUA50440.1 enterobactin exporter EntS [Oligella ureolytica]
MKSTTIYATPGFLPFLAARLCAVFAMQIQAIVVVWQVYDTTRDPLSLAYVGLVQFIPMLLLLPYAGDVIDRFSRKAILAISWFVAALCSGILVWMSLTNSTNVMGFYVALLLFGASRAFMMPALQSFLPQIIPRERLAQAIATNSMTVKIATISGPMIGGVLYAYAGGVLTYLVCCIAYLFGILLLKFVPILYRDQHKKPTNNGSNVWQRFSEGIRFIRKQPIILGSISLDLFAVLLGGVIALLPIYAQDILHTDSAGLGLLRSAMAIGQIATGIYLSRYPFERHVGKAMLIAVAIFGCANLAFSLSSIFWLSFATLMVAGAADMVSVYVRLALMQYATPDYLRGRVNAVNSLFSNSATELGSFRAGTSAALIGTVPTAVLGSLCTLVVVALITNRIKTLRLVDRFDEVTPS